jgi:DNA-binding NarL/FixJ family response regulator
MNSSIVIIDDEGLVSSSLTAFLEDKGFSVSSAADAAEGFKLIKELKPLLAIIDLTLPDMSGEDLAQKVLSGNPDFKCIIFTGYSDYEIPEKLIKAGMDKKAVLHKPVMNLESITELIAYLTG